MKVHKIPLIFFLKVVSKGYPILTKFLRLTDKYQLVTPSHATTSIKRAIKHFYMRDQEACPSKCPLDDHSVNITGMHLHDVFDVNSDQPLFFID